MKKTLVTILLSLIMVFGLFSLAEAAVRIKGYFRSSGTFVQPHYRSNPNSSIFDNWSTKGNTNPYTGKSGTVNPFSSYRFRW